MNKEREIERLAMALVEDVDTLNEMSKAMASAQRLLDRGFGYLPDRVEGQTFEEWLDDNEDKILLGYNKGMEPSFRLIWNAALASRPQTMGQFTAAGFKAYAEGLTPNQKEDATVYELAEWYAATLTAPHAVEGELTKFKADLKALLSELISKLE